MRLVIATRNAHKLNEIRSILALPGLTLVDLGAYPNVPEVVEDGVTFESNAVKKAVIVALSTGEWALADDSGLEVTALNGAPGVHSARYAGEPVSYHANNAKLMDAIREAKDRGARFRCVIALSSPKGLTRIVEGTCDGHIIHELRGTAGFGYDPLFVPSGHDRTFAELGDQVKNGISHRSRALALAKTEWSEVLSGELSTWPRQYLSQSRRRSASEGAPSGA